MGGLEHATGLYGQDTQSHLQLRDGFLQFDSAFLIFPIDLVFRRGYHRGVPRLTDLLCCAIKQFIDFLVRDL